MRALAVALYTLAAVLLILSAVLLIQAAGSLSCEPRCYVFPS
jgi:hypothetical protein